MSDKKQPQPPWKVSLLSLDIEAARDMLRNNYVNRPINQKTVTRYAKDMREGLWQEPTVIYRNGGKLIDGQHRLTALIEANCELWFVMVDHANPEIIDSIDGGVRRTDAQRLIMHGKSKQISGLLGSMLGFVLNYKEGFKISSGNISFPDKLEFLNNHQDMEDYAEHWSNMGLNGINVKRAVVGSIHFLTSKIDKEKADEFFSQISQNELDEGSPAKAFREFVSKLNKKQTPNDIRMTAIALLQAWHAFNHGNILKRIVPSAEVPHLVIEW